MNKQIASHDRHSIKRRRIKMFFLQAAKEIIISEGHENVSVRKISDRAGYSYATIYNYYTDLNELLWEVKTVMIKDLVEYIKNKMNQSSYDIDGIKKLFKTYIEYYFDNPNIFKFFYLHQLIKSSRKPEETETGPDFDELWAETFNSFVLEGKIQAKDIEVVSKIFIYSVQGMLTLNSSNNGNMSKEVMYNDLEKIVDYLL